MILWDNAAKRVFEGIRVRGAVLKQTFEVGERSFEEVTSTCVRHLSRQTQANSLLQGPFLFVHPMRSLIRSPNALAMLNDHFYKILVGVSKTR